MAKKLQLPAKDIAICSNCNPKLYLKFNFSFFKENGQPAKEDAYKLLSRLNFLSTEKYSTMIYKFSGDKKNYIERIPLYMIKKDVPSGFREIYPVESNEKYDVFRIYPAGRPSGSANPRIIGMIKNTIFYIFYIDWKGDLYSHE